MMKAELNEIVSGIVNHDSMKKPISYIFGFNKGTLWEIQSNIIMV